MPRMHCQIEPPDMILAPNQDIAVDFPEKNVTLLHSGSRLIEFIGPKAAD